MEESYSIPLAELVNEFQFEVIHKPDHFEDIKITTAEVSRPGLALSGYFGVFEPWRIQLFGNAERKYLLSLPEGERKTRIVDFIEARPTAVLITTNNPVFDEMLEAAERVGVPILRTPGKTSPTLAALIASLGVHLAPRITRHGVLVEVYGEGLLILGESGVGKSETAIELVKRGHRLIADDAVEIKKVSNKTLVGSAPAIISHYVELRGLGVVDVSRLFGAGAVKPTERIDLVINMEQWIEGKMYDRLGLDEEKMEILGIEVPSITVPVRPGRNLAIILEIAAMNNREKKSGYNAAEEFNKKIMTMFGES